MAFDTARSCRAVRPDRRSHCPGKSSEEMATGVEAAFDFRSQPRMDGFVRSHQSLNQADGGPRLRGGDALFIASPKPPPAISAGNPYIRRATGASISSPSRCAAVRRRSEEHTSELQSLMRISYAVFCLKKKTKKKTTHKS